MPSNETDTTAQRSGTGDDGVFVVVAHRWGWINSNWYLVGGCTRRMDAVDMAGREADDRGGKYGVAVYRLACDENAGSVLEAYFPSLYEEERPVRNTRIDIFQRLGLKAFFAVETGIAHLPDRNNATVLRATPVAVPDWLREEKERIEGEERAVQKLTRRATSPAVRAGEAVESGAISAEGCSEPPRSDNCD
jgi:hypothetical protein